MGKRQPISTSAFYRIVFVLALFMLFFISSISYKQLRALNDSDRLVRLSNRVNFELEQLLSYVKDAETGQRGYLLTKDSIYLQPYQDALVHIDGSFNQLNYLLRGSRIQQNNFKQLHDLVEVRITELQQTLKTATAGETIPDSLRLHLSRGNTLMYQIRRQTEKMIAAESRLLKLRSSAHSSNLFFTPLAALLLSIFSLIVFVASFVKINSDRKQMTRLGEQAMQARIVNESEKLYRRLIEGLPRALYTCDTEGRIQLYNRAAIELWGREPKTDEQWAGAWKMYRPDGTPLPNEESPMAVMVRSGRIINEEFVIERPDGVKRNVLSYPQPLYDSAGQISGGLTMLVDITEQKRSQNALEESELRLRIAMEATKLATWDLDLLTDEIIYSPRLNEIFGHGLLHEMSHNEMRSQIDPQDRHIVYEAHERALKTGIYFYEACINKPDGTSGWIRTEGKVIFDEHDQPVRMLGTLVDITDHKRNQERVAMLSAIVESSDDAIISKTLEGIITSWNHSATRIFGYTEKEMIGQPVLKLIPPDRQEEEPQMLEKLKRGERVEHFETKRIAKDGTVVDISLSLSPVKNEKGVIIGASKIARDITEQKRAETLVRENENKAAVLGAIVESSDDAIVSKTLEGIVTSWNDSAQRIFGYTKEEMIGQPILKIIPPDRQGEEPLILEKLKRGERVDHFETKRITKDGRIVDISLSLSPVKNDKGVIIGASKIARDVTEQKRAQLLLMESEDRFRVLIDAAPVLVWMAGTDKLCYFFNKSWLDFTGRTMEQEQGSGWAEGVHPDDYDRCLKIYLEAFDLREEFYMEYRLRYHDGGYRWISDKGVPRFSPDGTFLGYIGGCMDISDQKDFATELEQQVKERTEELKKSNNELRKQKEFAETILDTSIDITIVYDKDLNFLSFNKAAEKKYEKAKEELIGRSLLEVYPQMGISKGREDVERALAGELVHNKKYRSPVTGLWYEDYLIPLRNADDEVYAVMVIARDITEMIRNEDLLTHLNESLMDKNTELERSNTELASFNHVASHDLQEPLRKIQTFISRIMDREQHTLSEKGVEYFGKIQSSANRMQTLIDDLLTFSRTNKADQHRETVDLNTVLEVVQKELGPSIEEKGALIEHDKMPTLEGIMFQFQQLFINLVGNALKYSKPDVKPFIRIHCETVKAEDYAILTTAADKEFYKITVSDNGIGFEPQYARQIFELFQRLHGKMEYSGTGIGLTICKKIVENHNGYITAEGEPGKGSVFTIFIPV